MFDDATRTWIHTTAAPRARRILRAWQATHPALRGWTIGELSCPISSPRTDAMQAALVGLAQRGDAAAASLLVAQLRPGLVTLARWAHATDQTLGSLDEAAAEVLSTFNETLMRHRLERRPTKISANLLLDTRQRMWRARHTHDRAVEAVTGQARTNGLTAVTSPEARADELDLLQAVGRGLGDLPGTDPSRRLTGELAYRAWVLDEPPAAVASDLGLGPTAARVRLCRLREVMRERRRADGPTTEGYGVTSRRLGSAPPERLVGPSLASRQ